MDMDHCDGYDGDDDDGQLEWIVDDGHGQHSDLDDDHGQQLRYDEENAKALETENRMLTEMVEQLKAQTLELSTVPSAQFNKAQNSMLTEMVEELVEELKQAKAKARKLETEKKTLTALVEQFETEDTALTARLNIVINEEQDMNEELETMEKLAEILEKHNVDITFVIDLAKE